MARFSVVVKVEAFVPVMVEAASVGHAKDLAIEIAKERLKGCGVQEVRKTELAKVEAI